MSFSNFDIKFEYEGKILEGACTIINVRGEQEFPYKFPLYRVSINNHLIHPDVYLYYEINSKYRRFFWYYNPHQHLKNKMYEAILKALEKIPSNSVSSI